MTLCPLYSLIACGSSLMNHTAYGRLRGGQDFDTRPSRQCGSILDGRGENSLVDPGIAATSKIAAEKAIPLSSTERLIVMSTQYPSQYRVEAASVGPDLKIGTPATHTGSTPSVTTPSL